MFDTAERFEANVPLGYYDKLVWKEDYNSIIQTALYVKYKDGKFSWNFSSKISLMRIGHISLRASLFSSFCRYPNPPRKEILTMGNKSSSHHVVEYRPHPTQVQQLQEAQNLHRETQKKVIDTQKQVDRQTKIVNEQKSKFEQEINQAKKEINKSKEDYNRIVKIATDTLNNATKKVAIVVGAPGAGKSTICKFLFGIGSAVTGENTDHVTTELSCHANDILEYDLVDTFGKMPDVRGIMRVLACAYVRGWDPVTLVVVANSRSKTFDDAANILKADKINIVQFEPRTFWRMTNSGIDPNQALGLTIFTDQCRLPKVKIVTPGDLKLEQGSISEGLKSVLKDLTWEKSQLASDFEGINIAHSFYMAKSIAERSTFSGTDLQFIDQN